MTWFKSELRAGWQNGENFRCQRSRLRIEHGLSSAWMVWSVVGGSKFIDAQGKPIHVKSVRIAEVKFGSIVFRGRFIIAALTSPLISMGRLLKMVGLYRPMRTATFLWCAIPSRSLCTSSATLCVLLESSECCPQMIHHLPHLQDLVMCSGLGAGRGKFSDSIFALRSSAKSRC